MIVNKNNININNDEMSFIDFIKKSEAKLDDDFLNLFAISYKFKDYYICNDVLEELLKIRSIHVNEYIKKNNVEIVDILEGIESSIPSKSIIFSQENIKKIKYGKKIYFLKYKDFKKILVTYGNEYGEKYLNYLLDLENIVMDYLEYINETKQKKLENQLKINDKKNKENEEQKYLIEQLKKDPLFVYNKLNENKTNYENTGAYLYFASNESNLEQNKIKCGMTIKQKERMINLNTSISDPKDNIKIIESLEMSNELAKKFEGIMHDLLYQTKANKEWFYISKEDCKKIIDQTDNYMKGILKIINEKHEKNEYEEFKKKYIINTNSEDDCIQWSYLENKFREWYESNKGKNAPNSKIIKKYFETNIFNEDLKVIKNPKARTTLRGWKKWKITI